MDTQQVTSVLLKTLDPALGHFTVSDASAKSGLPLREAEKGLHWLVQEYRGQLSVTEQGQLLFKFPTGFSKPWQTPEALSAFWQKTKSFVKGVAKFVVRAWISVVMVAYVAIFAAILIALSLRGSSDDREDKGPSLGSSLLLHSLIRLVLDSLYWTFHPFSPFYVGYHRNDYDDAPKVPFYERVNRFFFGPEEAQKDPLEDQRKILGEIRANQGRITLASVMRVTGLSRQQVDPMMSRLLLDFNGEVEVSEQGGIIYTFMDVQKSAQSVFNQPRPAPIWQYKKEVLPFTGNKASSNFLIGGLNLFNLVMSSVAIQNGWTLEKLRLLFLPRRQAVELLANLPEQTPLLLGWVPFWFSLALFGLVAWRFITRPKYIQEISEENGRRGLLRGILEKLNWHAIPENDLQKAWESTAGAPPSDKTLVRELVKFGGQAEVSDKGDLGYRFPDLQTDARALSESQKQAKSSERQVGSIVYTDGN